MEDIRITDKNLTKNGFLKSKGLNGNIVYSIKDTNHQMQVILNKDGKFHCPNIGISFVVENLNDINDTFKKIMKKDMID
ncbi:MAG: hypothetical protein WBM13_09220 [Bacteroidia bacterium]